MWIFVVFGLWEMFSLGKTLKVRSTGLISFGAMELQLLTVSLKSAQK